MDFNPDDPLLKTPDIEIPDDPKAAAAMRGDDLPEPEPKKDEPPKGDEEPPKGDEEPPKGDKSKDEPSKDKLDDEDEETDEERAEREAAEAEAQKKQRIRIPKARFDEAMAKARAREAALQDKIKELEVQQAGSKQAADLKAMQDAIDAKQDAYEDLLLDGDKDKARAVRKEIDKMRADLIEHTTAVRSEQTQYAVMENLQYNAALAKVESTYAVLNPDSEDFDSGKTDEVAVLMEAFMARGFARADSLTKAVKYVMGPGNPQAKDAAAAADEAVQKAAREAAARKKAADADKKQPASMAKAGKDTDRGGLPASSGIDIMRMDQDAFAKMDEATLSKLRGDEM